MIIIRRRFPDENVLKLTRRYPTGGAAMRVHFSTDDLPPRDRGSWFEYIAEHGMKVTPAVRPDPVTFRAQLDTVIAGRFKLFDFKSSDSAGGRTPADVHRDRRAAYHLRRSHHGKVVRVSPTRQRFEEIPLRPGDFYIISSEWPFEASSDGGTAVSGLIIPPEVLEPLLTGGRLMRPIPVRSDSPLGSLFGDAFDAASARIPLLSPELGDGVLQNLSGLVALACGASEEGRWNGRDSLRAARLEAAKRHIEQHLAEPGLAPASTAAALGISVRHLHLLFEPTGTSFAQYVAQRRLLQCRAALTSPNGTHRSVADIAFGWGFNSLATFYRAFQREFGMPPAALRTVGAASHSD
jgi:AraC-like DNA-binding protein